VKAPIATKTVPENNWLITSFKYYQNGSTTTAAASPAGRGSPFASQSTLMEMIRIGISSEVVKRGITSVAHSIATSANRERHLRAGGCC
jgi:hypothetical protein